MPLLATVLDPGERTDGSIAHQPSEGLGVAPRVRPGSDPLGGGTDALGKQNERPGEAGRDSTAPVRAEVGFEQPSLFDSRVDLVPVGLSAVCPGV